MIDIDIKVLDIKVHITIAQGLFLPTILAVPVAIPSVQCLKLGQLTRVDHGYLAIDQPCGGQNDISVVVGALVGKVTRSEWLK